MSNPNHKLAVDHPSARRSWRDRLINPLASLFLVCIWVFTAWVVKKLGLVESEDHFFTLLVAVSLALHLHEVKR